MRLAVLSSVTAATLLISSLCSARVLVVGSQGSVWLEPSMFNAPVASVQPVYTVVSTEPPRAIYEHAFFTPVPNFQQSGYQCAGMVSVDFRGGIRHLHRGTYCIR